MKQFRHLIAVAIAAALVLGAHAGAVDSAMARAAAEAWAAANPAFGAGGTALSAEADYEGGVLMWWTVRLSGGGAAFVAPETSLEPVLAAVPSYGGALPAAHPLRSILAADVANRRAKIAEATAAPVSNSGLVARGASASAITNEAIAAAVTAAEGKWAKFASGRSSLKPRALAPTANITVVDGFGDESANRWMRFWDQSSFNWDGEFVELCFNLYTPSNSVCGCVATAGAALLQWFGCTGLLHNVMRECKYDGEPVKLTTMSGTNPYDWASLPPSMGGSGTEGVSDSVIETLGRAAYDVGVCVKMMYTLHDSGSYMNDLATSLVDDFGFYSAKWLVIKGTNDYPQVFSDIQKGNPVGLSITGAAGGHAILGVGYGEDEEGTPYTRLFMGWGGFGDAWYNLPAINAAGMSFNNVRGAIVKMKFAPPEGFHKTLDDALAAARASGKPLLLVSGVEDDAGTKGLLDYITANDIGADFEIYFADYSVDPMADQNPSYGVFNPLVFNRDADNRWAFYNGRLAYGADADTAVFAEVLAEGLAAWGSAYEDYLLLQDAATNGIYLVETECWDRPWDEERFTSTRASYDNVYTNGQTVTLTAPATPVTNDLEGVVWGVAGWSLSNVVDYVEEDFETGVHYVASSNALVASGTGTNASFTVEADSVYLLRWEWKPEAVRLSASADTGRGTVSPSGDSWQPYGSMVSVVAVPRPKTVYNWQFSHWSKDTDGSEEAGSVITVTMDRPRAIVANFVQAKDGTGSTASYTLTVSANPESVTAPISPSSVTYGVNRLLNGPAAVTVPANWTDSDGNEWRCTGWTGTGSVPATGTGSVAGFGLTEDSSLVWNWKSTVYSVQFDGNGGSVTQATKRVTYGEPYGYLPPPETRTGYKFGGWSIAADGSAPVTAETVVTNDEPHTLYAAWIADDYHLYCNPNGGRLAGSNFGADNGTVNTALVMVIYGTTEYSGLGVALREGYVFDGWYTTPGDGGELVFDTNGMAVACTYWSESRENHGTWQYVGGLTVYAHWVEVVQPEPPDPPEPPAPPVLDPAEAPIGPVDGNVTNSAIVIYPTNGTQLAVETRVSNVSTGYWYSIWSAPAVTGTYSFVSAPYAGTGKTKVEDEKPDILTLCIIVDPVEASKFYKVYVTEEEPGN